MPYFIEEIKSSMVVEHEVVNGVPVPTDRMMDTGIGEWDIKEAFSMGLVAKVYSKKTLDEFMAHLYRLEGSKLEEGDLVGLAQMIKNCLKEWIQKYPDGGHSSYNDAIDFVIGKVMQKSKGTLDPSMVRKLVLMERKPFGGTNYFIGC